MAEETKNPEQPEAAPEEVSKKKPSFFNQKVLLIGLPLFIVQLVVVYFITANFLLNKVQGSVVRESTKTEENQKEKSADNGKPELGKYIYLIEDIIVNPAGTEGKKLLLTSVGFDLATDAEQKELKSKEVLVKDVIVSTLSSKTLEQLSDSSYRDTLKKEIGSRIKGLVPDIKLNAVYLSKYIIQ
jgi:flagellar protein FliL